MKKHKKKISLILALIIMIVHIPAISLPAYADNVPLTNVNYTLTVSADVRLSPYAFTPVSSTLTAGQEIVIIERDGQFFYVEYKLSSETQYRRGYISYDKVNIDKTTIKWCNHEEYNPGYIISDVDVPVFLGPSITSGPNLKIYIWSSTLTPDVGDDTGYRPLLVLRQEREWYFVQFVFNYTQLSNEVQPFYVRGWVRVADVALDRPQMTDYFDNLNLNHNYTLIKNVSNSTSGGKYLTAKYDGTTNRYYAVLEEPTGNDDQQWLVIPFEKKDSNNNVIQTYYKIQSKEYERYLHVEDSLPMAGADIVLEPLSDPNKAQEFWLEEYSTGHELGNVPPQYVYNGEEVGHIYRVRTRVTGGYQSMSINGVTGVCESRVNATWKDVWAFERLNKYWDGTYKNISTINNISQLSFYIEEGVYNGDVAVGLTKNEISSAFKRWNDIQSNENRCVNIIESTNNNANIVVSLKNLGTKMRAQQMPIIEINNVQTESTDDTISFDVDKTWVKSKIYLNTNPYQAFSSITPQNSNFSYEEIEQRSILIKQGVLCHEFGHALKIMHPYGQSSSDYADQVVYSVMNQGVYVNIDDPSHSGMLKVSYYPTEYDRQTLINKWKGE